MIPIFIITCDRLTVLERAIQSYHNSIHSPFGIVICDMGTTFQPTIDFLAWLETEKLIKVYQMIDNPNKGKERNVKRDDNWIRWCIDDYFKSHPKSKYVVTDPDIVLDNVNGDILHVYAHILDNISGITAVGPMLRIDDVPDYFPQKKKLITTSLHVDFHNRKTSIMTRKNKIHKSTYSYYFCNV